MKHHRFVLLGVLAMAVLPAYGQSAGPKVKQALEDAANGQCSSVLSPLVKQSCETQIQNMAATLKKLGKLESLSFKGMENLPQGGNAEAWEAVHQNGRMLWLARLSSDDKLNVFWTPGPGPRR